MLLTITLLYLQGRLVAQHNWLSKEKKEKKKTEYYPLKKKESKPIKKKSQKFLVCELIELLQRLRWISVS